MELKVVGKQLGEASGLTDAVGNIRKGKDKYDMYKYV